MDAGQPGGGQPGCLPPHPTWRLERISNRKGDRKFSYGYKRFSLLGALFSSFVLIGGSVFVVSEAIDRLQSPQPLNAPGMVVFAILGIGINGYAAIRMHGGKNLNSRIITWHLLEDVLGWTAVLAASVVLIFFNLPIIDPILSLFVTAIIIFNVIKNLRKTLVLFLQGVPDQVDVDLFEKNILKMEMVEGSHHTHVWSLDGDTNVLTTHIVLCPGAKKEQIRAIKTQAREFAQEAGVSHSTIEFEYLEEDCSMNNGRERVFTNEQ